MEEILKQLQEVYNKLVLKVNEASQKLSELEAREKSLGTVEVETARLKKEYDQKISALGAREEEVKTVEDFLTAQRDFATEKTDFRRFKEAEEKRLGELLEKVKNDQNALAVRRNNLEKRERAMDEDRKLFDLKVQGALISISQKGEGK